MDIERPEAGAILDIDTVDVDRSRLLPQAALDAMTDLKQLAARFESGLFNTRNGAESIVGELVTGVSAALRALTILWNECEHICTSSSGDTLSRDVNALAYRLLIAHTSQMRALEGDIPTSLPAWKQALACLMALARWRAKWSWLRYERPSARFWVIAAYAYESGERWSSTQEQFELDEPDARRFSIESEYLGMLFRQWVDPFCLSTVAHFLLERLISDRMVSLPFQPSSNDQSHLGVDLATGNLVSDAKAPGTNLRFPPLMQLKEAVHGELVKMQNEPASSLRDALAQLSRSVVGRKADRLIRLGHRVRTLSLANVVIGFHNIIASRAGAMRHDATGLALDPPQVVPHECVVRDHSIQGCRLFLPVPLGDSLHIGTLLYLQGVFANERSLGIVRWLNRVGPTDWEAGVWLLRGSISILLGREEKSNAASCELSGERSKELLVVDSDEESDGLVMGMVARTSAMHVSIAVPSANTRLRLIRHMETGYDFDLNVYRIDDIT